MTNRFQRIRPARFLPFLAALIPLFLPAESPAFIRRDLPDPGSLFASEWETCRNDPVNNSDPLGLEGGNVVSAYGLVGLEDGVYRNDFGYAQLARTHEIRRVRFDAATRTNLNYSTTRRVSGDTKSVLVDRQATTCHREGNDYPQRALIKRDTDL